MPRHLKLDASGQPNPYPWGVEPHWYPHNRVLAPMGVVAEHILPYTAAIMHRICTFCGSRPRALTLYSEAAAEFGKVLAKRGITLVYGGSATGLMGSVAGAALDAGGDVIGVIPDALAQKEPPLHRLTQIILVSSLHERKRAMFDLSDAFVALPGGIGTLEQFVEVLSWATFGIHAKPIGLLNVNGYFDPLLRLLDRMVSDRFLGAPERSAILVEKVAERLVDRLGTARPRVFEPVLTEAQT